MFARTEAGPEEDFGDHCVGAAGSSRPRGVCVQSVWMVLLALLVLFGWLVLAE
jgi:hypothetical protein